MAIDLNFSSVGLLVHFDDADGSTTPLDSSLSAHALSGVATAKVSRSQSKWGAGSLDVTNASAQVTTPVVTDFNFGAGQFTVEAWVRPSVNTGLRSLVGQWAATTNLGWWFGFNGSNLIFNYSTTGTDTPSVSGSYTPTLNTWVHIAVDRDASNVLRVYAGGAVIGSATVAATLFASTRSLSIGNNGNTNAGSLGQIDDLRITKGVARYAGAFTPPTDAFPDTDHFSTLLAQGLARETIGTSTGVLQVQGLVREVIGAPGVGSNRLLVQGLVREILRPAASAPAPLHASLSRTLAPATLTSSARVPIRSSLSQTLAPAALVARGSLDDDAYSERYTEDNQERATETSAPRYIEQTLPIETTATVNATLAPATVAAFTGRLEVHAYVEGLYVRVTERSPSTPHPDPTQDYLPRVTEQWWRPGLDAIGEPDDRILQHQLIGGATVAVLTATLRTHVGERHYLTASRARPQLIARSDFRKTRAA
jgi:hypothetical protein